MRKGGPKRDQLMIDRIHLAVDPADKERYRQVAARQGKSLSVWLREAAEEKWKAEQEDRSLTSQKDLRAFFANCDQVERGREPDWDSHRRVIVESISGMGPSS